VEAIILITSQFGGRLVNVYGLGKEKGKKYPTEDELKKLAEETRKKMTKEQPENTGEESKGKKE
jgi:hypothetical protein